MLVGSDALGWGRVLSERLCDMLRTTIRLTRIQYCSCPSARRCLRKEEDKKKIHKPACQHNRSSIMAATSNKKKLDEKDKKKKLDEKQTRKNKETTHPDL